MRTHIRSVKPEFFKNEDLYALEKSTGLPVRICFQGLWIVADREGRFEWKPKILKLDIAPWDEFNFEEVLLAMERAGFIFHYESGGKTYGCIPTFLAHQVINKKEAKSTIPAPSTEDFKRFRVIPVNSPEPPGELLGSSDEPPGNSGGEGKGKEGKGNGKEKVVGERSSRAYARNQDQDSTDGRDDDADDGQGDDCAEGAIPELADLPGAEMLSTVKHVGQRVWISVYGLDFVREHIPLVFAKWTACPDRAKRGDVPLYITSWFHIEKAKGRKSRGNPTETSGGRQNLRKSDKPCRQAINPETQKLAPGICSVHRTHEFCQIEGRLG